MKKSLMAMLAVTALVFAACNNSETNKAHDGHDSAKISTDAMQQPAGEEKTEVRTIQVAFPSIDAQAASAVKEIVSHYLHIKNALVNDNSSEAASGAKAMQTAISSMDKSLLSAAQKLAYDKQEGALKDHALAIAKTGDKIAEQRAHFVPLSNAVYELVKNFGGGRTLYHDHCPMARDNQGAMWMSETKEVKNPYFGAEMLTCGSVEEQVK